MYLRGMKVKITDVSGSFVSIKYLSSNARSRIKKDDFIKDFQSGVFEVKNPSLLDEINETQEVSE